MWLQTTSRYARPSRLPHIAGTVRRVRHRWQYGTSGPRPTSNAFSSAPGPPTCPKQSECWLFGWAGLEDGPADFGAPQGLIIRVCRADQVVHTNRRLRPATPIRGPRRFTTAAGRTSTVTPPTSLSRSLRAADIGAPSGTSGITAAGVTLLAVVCRWRAWRSGGHGQTTVPLTVIAPFDPGAVSPDIVSVFPLKSAARRRHRVSRGSRRR